jgi:hypothetical protein
LYSDPDDELAFGLCELGYVSLTELRAVRGNLGLPLKCDLHCDADKAISA